MGYYNSFVVRVWSDESGRVHGRIEHVTSQESLMFVDLDEISAFIRTRLTPPPNYFPQPGQAPLGKEPLEPDTLPDLLPPVDDWLGVDLDSLSEDQG